MSESPWVVDVSEANFEAEVLETSKTTPVLVDFWAPWCGPCKALGPILEKLADEMQGRFKLAKVNSDQNPQLAQAFGVQGIPSVKLVADGQIADEFTGALPESAVRQFLENVLSAAPGGGEGGSGDKLADAKLLEEQGELQSAADIYSGVLLEQPESHDALIGLARILHSAGDRERALEQLEKLDDAGKKNPEAVALLAKLSFDSGGGDLGELEQAVETDPVDPAARLALARAYVGADRYEEGLIQFLEVVKIDREFEDQAGKAGVLKVFEMIGPTHALVKQYRPRLSALLFS